MNPQWSGIEGLHRSNQARGEIALRGHRIPKDRIVHGDGIEYHAASDVIGSHSEQGGIRKARGVAVVLVLHVEH